MRRSNWLSRFWRSSLFLSKHFIRLVLFSSIFSKTPIAFSWKFPLPFEVEGGVGMVIVKLWTSSGIELLWLSSWLAIVAETYFITCPVWCHHSSIASKNLLSWWAFSEIPFAILSSLYALKRFSCFLLQVVADRMNFGNITTILACSLVHVSILSRKTHKIMKENLKIGSKKTITAQVCKRMKSTNWIENCMLAHSNHQEGRGGWKALCWRPLW